MYYVETMADNYGYANHRVICRIVIGSSLDTFDSFWEMDSDKKLNRKLNRPRH
jgi:hypothetical protein